MTNNSANLNEQWREFLRRNVDARSVIEGIMDRTGFEEDEVLSYLLKMWRRECLPGTAARNLRAQSVRQSPARASRAGPCRSMQPDSRSGGRTGVGSDQIR